MKLAKYFDEIIKIKIETPESAVKFDDIMIFNKKDNKGIILKHY
jgi:hypothetical protein